MKFREGETFLQYMTRQGEEKKEAFRQQQLQPEYQAEQLKKRLDNDYRLNKLADGEYTQEEWAVISAERRGWRAELRALLGEK